MEAVLTNERLREVLKYNPFTGVFTWRVNVSRTKAGTVAGRITSDGYCQIKVDGKSYVAQRLAWFYMRGTWPSKNVIHKDEDLLNNRWMNLKEASPKTWLLTAPGKSGMPRGVRFNANGDRFVAQITHNNACQYIGTFDTALEAHDAYLAKRQELHGNIGWDK